MHRPRTSGAGIRRLAGALALVSLASSAGSAATIGYWRMEVDEHNSPNRLEVPNELAGGTPLESTEAALDGANLPTTSVPLTTDTNQFSVAAVNQGADNGINASAVWYAQLAVTSISIEFWARTVETTAIPFRFSTGGLDGVTIENPNSLQVTYTVDVGGIPTQFALLDLDDMDATWSHYAFVYDETDGVASFYVDGSLVASFDGPDDSPLLIVPGTPVEIGVLMDYAEAGQGTIDEVRMDGTALVPELFLLPEPGTGVLVAFGLCALAADRRARRRGRARRRA